jgi:hypothetical protein
MTEERIAVAIVHGVGRNEGSFHEEIAPRVARRFRKETGSADGLVVEPVLWASVLQASEDSLWEKMTDRHLRWKALHRFLLDFAGDAIAYQTTPRHRETYDAVHAVFARAMKTLAERAGPTAPLCVIGHSLGSVIASNFLYDLHEEHERPMLAEKVKDAKGESPLERGETLAHLYTLGSPLVFWSLRRGGFDKPVQVPSPYLPSHRPGLPGEWVNFFDVDDPIAWPLKPLNEAYDAGVTEDLAVRSGPGLLGWTPVSHQHYGSTRKVASRIAEGLARTWRALAGP